MSRKVDKLSGLVVITGASSGIGLELARCAARDRVELVLAADRDLSETVAAVTAEGAAAAEAVRCDLATDQGISQLMEAIGDRQVAALFANAGHGGGGAFLDQDWEEARHIIETNITGTARLVQIIGRQMRERDEGRILVVGSIAGHMPGAFHLVYNATKSFTDEFAAGLRNELKNTGVVVSCLQPGPTDTDFFERAHIEDTPLGRGSKADPAKAAEDGYKALLADEDHRVSGFMNKVQAVFADLLPEAVVAQMHRRMAESEGHKQIEERRKEQPG